MSTPAPISPAGRSVRAPPESGLDFPQPIIVAHENAAVCMALGYTMVTGRPQAVMVHVSVGTANAVLGLMNASRDNIPLLFTAGRTPWFEEGRLGRAPPISIGRRRCLTRRNGA